MQIRLLPDEYVLFLVIFNFHTILFIFLRNGVPEWMVIELQGLLEFNAAAGIDGRKKAIGHFAWSDDGKSAHLVIGHQLLNGKVQNNFMQI
jgi:hypothetical protein